MSLATAFSLSSFLVLPLWVLMIALPGWKLTYRVLQSPLVCLAPALLYLLLVVPALGSLLPALLNPDAAGMASLLGTPEGATIAWVHFLAFDLFVGRWIYLDSRQRGVNPWLVAPVLFLTLMTGPLGFSLYLALRLFYLPAGTTATSVAQNQPG
jgi:hypothetical protein